MSGGGGGRRRRRRGFGGGQGPGDGLEDLFGGGLGLLGARCCCSGWRWGEGRGRHGGSFVGQREG